MIIDRMILDCIKLDCLKRDLKIIFLLVTVISPVAIAGGVYQEPAEFIKQVFDNEPPKAKVLWLNKELKAQITGILDHKYNGLRIRYWQDESKNTDRTIWVLEEIGKDKMITTGVVVNKQKIELIKILVFRESRGWEVRHDFFTDQFKQAELDENLQLSQTIDNISGATLSVRAVRKLAQIALLLDKQVQNNARK